MVFILFVIQSFFIGLIGTWLFEQVLKINKKLRKRYYQRHEIILGYHTHHSVYGIIFIFAGIVLFFVGSQDLSLFLIMSGLGIIAMHTLSSGRLVFIEKQR